MGWQPIETAPKNKIILVYVPPKKRYFLTVYMAIWRDVYNAFCIFYSYDIITHEESTIKPTHWMPLPEPPKL